MYIKRSIEQDMLKWKNTKDHNVLEIRGARQVGKTTTIEHFCNENYKNVMRIDLSTVDSEDFRDVVSSFKMERPKPATPHYLGSYAQRHGFVFTNDTDTVVIFDEIQESQEVYEMIRPFHRELQCDVIVTGSYLNKALKYFQPAGDVDILTMYPISFPEFVQCFDKCESYLNWYNAVLNDDELLWLQKAYNVYAEIGGYPLAVISYLNNGLEGAEDAHRRIMSMLNAELRVRIGNVLDFQKLQTVFESVIDVLLREKKGNKKLISVLSRITDSVSTFRISELECYSAIAWLKEAGIVEFCNKRDLTSERTFFNERLFFSDLGIFSYLCHKYEIDDSTITGIRNETFVFKSLVERDFTREFYGDGPAFAVMREYEIDFYVSSRDKRRYGIEVKSGKNVGKSIQEALKSNAIDYAVNFKGNCNYGITDRVITVPLALAYQFRYCLGGKKNSSSRIPTASELRAF